jgi:hypothetical protein
MGYVLDPEIAAVFATMAATGSAPLRPARGDWRAFREIANANLRFWANAMPAFPETATYRARAAMARPLNCGGTRRPA